MIAINQDNCPQNHACPAVSRCPAGALIQDDIFSAPRVDEECCTECGVCTRVCRVFSHVSDVVGVA